MNISALQTLFYKESLRFWKVATQTITAPILTTLLYLLVFAHVLQKHIEVYPGVQYLAFLIPGLVMMSILQNAFANTASSLIQSKVTGNIVFILLPPIGPLDLLISYVLASIVRGFVVGLGVLLTGIWFVDLTFSHVGWILAFAFLASSIAGLMGMIAGIWAEKFDQMAAFQSFIIMPATFLSGVFYSTHSLPSPWHMISRFNPFFYMVDGFRYGFLGHSDVDPYFSLIVMCSTLLLCTLITFKMLSSGYKLRY